MKAVKPTALLLAAFGLALAAGVAGGLLLARLPAAQGRHLTSATSASPLGAELGLTAKQAEEMRRIWEGVRDTAQQCFDDGRRLQKDRDDALVALLTDEQKEKFEKISNEYAERFAELNRRRDAEFRSAVRQTRQVLTESQWQKYEQILRNRVGPGPLRSMTEEQTAELPGSGL
jgi:Spy/CpxP family protein refolding chaperone